MKIGGYRRLEKNLALSFVIFMMISLILGTRVAAVGLSLPSTPVLIEVSDGVENYFDTVLSSVPSGFDVANGTYPGWCVDIRTEMVRSPATHAVILYSTIDPPGELVDEKWDIVNYILNHKQGNAVDIQQAIWYFVHLDGGYSPTSTVAWAIVNDALENGEGFLPGSDQVMAVICYPTILFPSQPDVQVSIIETTHTVIPESASLLILPFFMVLSFFAAIAYKRRRFT